MNGTEHANIEVLIDASTPNSHILEELATLDARTHARLRKSDAVSRKNEVTLAFPVLKGVDGNGNHATGESLQTLPQPRAKSISADPGTVRDKVPAPADNIHVRNGIAVPKIGNVKEHICILPHAPQGKRLATAVPEIATDTGISPQRQKPTTPVTEADRLVVPNQPSVTSRVPIASP